MKYNTNKAVLYLRNIMKREKWIMKHRTKTEVGKTFQAFKIAIYKDTLTKLTKTYKKVKP